MPTNRSDAARRAESIPNTRRAPHLSFPTQNRRTIPAPDGLSKVGRSATARRGPHRIDAAIAGDGMTVPRGFPLGDPDYRAVPGQPADFDVTGPLDPAGPASEVAAAAGPDRQPERPPEGRVLRRVGTGRAPFRSAVLGGALLVAVFGAGVTAWAMASTGAESDQGGVGQSEQSGGNQPPLSTAELSVPSTGAPDDGVDAGASSPKVPAAGGDAANSGSAAPAASSPAKAAPQPPAAAEVITNPTAPPAANLGPATVSAVQPGDPGFGWPSTAFGLPPEPATGQPAG
jgi:hypothetical protein